MRSDSDLVRLVNDPQFRREVLEPITSVSMDTTRHELSRFAAEVGEQREADKRALALYPRLVAAIKNALEHLNERDEGRRPSDV